MRFIPRKCRHWTAACIITLQGGGLLRADDATPRQVEPVWKSVSAVAAPAADVIPVLDPVIAQVQDVPPKAEPIAPPVVPPKDDLPVLPETRVQASPSPLAFPPETSQPTPNPFGQAPTGNQGLGSNLIGTAPSASAGRISQTDIQYRRFNRPGEVLEIIPGLIVTPHSGGGKANQWGLRGTYMDHGTDFSLFVDGIPVNLPTHAHGQGYLDVNWIIPELIEGIEYRKGPYYADVGDFSATGTAAMRLANTLTENFSKFETGMYGYNRFVTGNSWAVGPGNLLFGMEARYQDTAWEASEKLQRFSGILKYSAGDKDAGFVLTGQSFYNQWTSTDQVPELAITSGLIDRFGFLDPTTGGNTYRHSANAEFWVKPTENSITRAQVYGVWYNLDLFSLLEGAGSQIEQFERRFYGGTNVSHQIDTEAFGFKQTNVFGVQFRKDVIPNIQLNKTTARKLDDPISYDAVDESYLSFYWVDDWKWTDRWRTQTGLRWDHFWFDVNSKLNDLNSGNSHADMISPKQSLIYKASDKVEFYLNGGFGFHSNDARGVQLRVAPDGAPVTERTPPLVRAGGAEWGFRTVNIIPKLNTTAAVFYLDIDSELIFAGDAGTTEPNGKTRRGGVDLTAFYSITDWWTIDANFTGTAVRFDQPDPETGGRFVPNTVPFVFSGGTQFKAPNGVFGSLRCRSFFAGPLTSDDAFRSEQTILFNAMLGYQRNNWTIGIEGINILNAQAPDVSYAYPFSLVSGGPEYFGRVIRPTDPIQARLFFSMTY